MFEYKCAKCGAGELEPLNDGRRAQCTYCNAVMVLPTLDPGTFNRALGLRLRKNFDQAEYQFENIVDENPRDSEAYWNLLLCRYGIDYVDDGGEMIPTCHRMSFNSILEDPDYERALRYADGASYRHYQEDAEKIDSIMQRIRSIAQNQPGYDIFISYKETDGQGSRTMDSVIAQSIYDELKEKHPSLNIFLSRVTLKEVAAGLEYEPFIFSALSTAKLMIVVGTSRENMDAEWVRNEWSRYQRMMLSDRKKRLTVVYKDMEPSDFPEGLQDTRQATRAEGFYLQDFVRGVEGLLDLKTKKLDAAAIFSASDGNMAENLVRRGQQELALKNWAEAGEYFQRAADGDPQCTDAWWGILQAETENFRPLDHEPNLSEGAKNAYRMVNQYAPDEVLSLYQTIMEKYIGEGREADRLRNCQATLDELSSKTGGFMLFDQYQEDMGCLRGLVHENNPESLAKRLADAIELYSRNYKHFQELRALLASKPLEKMEREPDYAAMMSQRGKLDGELNSLRGKDSGLQWINVLFGALMVGLAVGGCTYHVNAFVWMLSSCVLPVLCVSTIFMVVYPLKEDKNGNMVRLDYHTVLWPIALLVGLIILFQFAGLWQIRRTYPDAPMDFMFAMPIAVSVYLGVLWSLFIRDHVWISSLTFVFGTYRLGIKFLELNLGWYKEEVLEQTMDGTAWFLLLASCALLIVRIFLRLRDGSVRLRKARAEKKREELKKKMYDYEEDYKFQLRRPFRPYVDWKYLQEL